MGRRSLKRPKTLSDWLAPTNPGPRDSVPECAQSSAAFAVNQPVTATTTRHCPGTGMLRCWVTCHIISKPRPGYTPWLPSRCRVKLASMDNKDWLIEAEVAFCLAVMSLIALTLMTGHNVWKHLVSK